MAMQKLGVQKQASRRTTTLGALYDFIKQKVKRDG
jgi:hypothetical protein